MTIGVRVTRAISVAAVVASLTVVATAVHNSIGTAGFLDRGSSEAAARAGYERFLCLQDELHAVIRRGSTVYAGTGDSAGSRLLSEVAAGWAQESPTSGGATVLVLHEGPGGCDGREIRVAAS